jgi:hypothetical protein
MIPMCCGSFDSSKTTVAMFCNNIYSNFQIYFTLSTMFFYIFRSCVKSLCKFYYSWQSLQSLHRHNGLCFPSLVGFGVLRRLCVLVIEDSSPEVCAVRSTFHIACILDRPFSFFPSFICFVHFTIE